MKIRTELDALHDNDIYSMLLFALYKATDTAEYSSLSQLAYILDKDNLLKFLEFFGGLTIKVPTIEDLENLVYGLLLYQQVDIEKTSYDDALNTIKLKCSNSDAVEDGYSVIKECLKNYNFNSGRN